MSDLFYNQLGNILVISPTSEGMLASLVEELQQLEDVLLMR